MEQKSLKDIPNQRKMHNKSIKATGNRLRRLLAGVSAPAPYLYRWAASRTHYYGDERV